MRVISLLPSGTEMICAIGGADRLVGRGHECCNLGVAAEAATAIEALPVLTAPRITVDGASKGIDEAVNAAKTAAEPLYRLDREGVIRLRPDVIVTQELCDVCAVGLDDVRSAADAIESATGSRPEIVTLNPHTIEDVFDEQLRIGAAIGLEDEARVAVVQLRERLFRAEEYVNAYVEGPIVGFMERTDPVYVAGHWTVELIERAGGRHPLNETVIVRENAGLAAGPQRGDRRAGRSIAVSDEIWAAARPDAIVIAPCGFGLEQAMTEATAVRGRGRAAGWWDDLPAVKKGRVMVVDGDQMFNRAGPRLVDAFVWLVSWLQDRSEITPGGFPAAALLLD